MKLKTKNKTSMKFFGFTLAEILITLAIIGVVAALTVPSIITKIGDTQTVSKLKKTYSELSNITGMIIAEQGEPKSWATSSNNLGKLYISKMNIMKNCANNAGCFSQTPYKRLSGTEASDWDTNENTYKFVMNNGQQVMAELLSADCMQDDTKKASYGSNNICAGIYVDINGTNKPNIIGRDVFAFVLKNNGLYPAGCDYRDEDGKVAYCSKKSVGHACTCKVLEEGAINY